MSDGPGSALSRTWDNKSGASLLNHRRVNRELHLVPEDNLSVRGERDTQIFHRGYMNVRRQGTEFCRARKREGGGTAHSRE